VTAVRQALMKAEVAATKTISSAERSASFVSRSGTCDIKIAMTVLSKIPHLPLAAVLIASWSLSYDVKQHENVV
jgi:hypothetical protein